ncbi:MAG: L-seryl-tRNA(Sec) selenium transferase [Acidobacteria bacterium]|nr:MAG: L-seryl-tRNA(Sec) selenium transferase [Acidobacteriota bacterium]
MKLRQIPSVDELLRRPALADTWAALGPSGSRRVIADCLKAVRAKPSDVALANLENDLRAAAQHRLQPSLRRVINATGVVLHTNLGRAPLAAAVAARMAEIASGYSNLELDLTTGRRSRRDRHLTRWFEELTGAPATIVVNNNAAAVLLAVHTLVIEPQGEVIVSRGELVEIGESFRIADIVARGGARLVEVGATNRTRLADYARALTPRTRMILRVHRSNFFMQGFVSQPEHRELAALARQRKIPLVEDLGSGELNLVRERLRAGVSLVTYSGDKLLGGPQAGMISGNAKLVEKLRTNPLFRALRAGSAIYAALEATLALYARDASGELPVVAAATAGGLEERTRRLAARLPPALGAKVVAGAAVMGGGSRPGETMTSWQIALPPALAAPLRRGEPPVVARVEHQHCLIDLRTVFAEEESALQAAIAAAYASQRTPANLPS